MHKPEDIDQLEQQDEQVPVKEKNEAWEWLKALAIALLIAIVIRSFLFAPIVVDGESMMPTLHDRERLIVNKAVYLIGSPKRGEIVVFHATENKDWIKRVIGLPGDVVEMKNDQLYINGEEIEEPYLEEIKASINGIITNDFYEEVPEQHLFVMGDNRLNSRDSRYIGSIPVGSVIGRADLAFWPVTKVRIVNQE